MDRRHCSLKWQSLVLTIREKINAAIQDMPESEEIARLLSGSCECLGVTLPGPWLLLARRRAAAPLLLSHSWPREKEWSRGVDARFFLYKLLGRAVHDGRTVLTPVTGVWVSYWPE